MLVSLLYDNTSKITITTSLTTTRTNKNYKDKSKKKIVFLQIYNKNIDRASNNIDCKNNDVKNNYDHSDDYDFDD